jgi:hypothetical protein
MWEDGYSLNEAWFLLCDEELRSQYREAGRNPNLTASLREMMRDDVLSKIQYGQLKAVGYRTRPDLSHGPELIDRAVFTRRENVNWDEKLARGIGREYVEIRIFRPGELSQPETSPTVQPDPPASDEPARHEMGRPSTIPKLVAIIGELDRSGKFRGKLQKIQNDLVRDEARRRHPHLFLGDGQPAKSTIVKAFTRYRGQTPD